MVDDQFPKRSSYSDVHNMMMDEPFQGVDAATETLLCMTSAYIGQQEESLSEEAVEDLCCEVNFGQVTEAYQNDLTQSHG